MVVVGALVFGELPATAQNVLCSRSLNGTAAACSGERIVTIPARTPRSARAPAGNRPAVVWVTAQQSAPGPDGRRCATRAARPLPGWIQPDPTPTPEPNLAAYLARLAPCPAPVRRAASPASPAAVLAERFLQEVPLPAPVPKIAPGRAITGLPAFLETNGATTHAFSRTTPFGAMAIAAAGQYRVDWGDGTTTGPHAIEGMPWPEGQIAHTYQNVGAYDVTVTQEWTATWQVGDQSGVIDGLATTARIGSFPVGQIQSVAINPPRPPRR